MPAEVVIRNLSKSYGRTVALHDFSLEIETGEIFGLLGTNGAGKTTAVECLTGLRAPDRGNVEVGGIDVRRESAEVRQHIGVVLQGTTLPDQITPREALALFGSLYRHPIEPAVLLDRFSLTLQGDARFATLSGGQRQRLALALAFVNQPRLLVLDEPTTGLDAHARRELHEDILRIKREGHTVLLTTHYLEEAEELCDRVAIIHHGSLVAIGTPRELIERTNGHQIITLLTNRPLDPQALRGLHAAVDVSTEGLSVRISSSAGTRTVQALVSFLANEKIELIDLHLRRATLEEAFMGLTQSERNAPTKNSA